MMSDNIKVEEYDYWDELPFDKRSFPNRQNIHDTLEIKRLTNSSDYKYVVVYLDGAIVAYTLIRLIRGLVDNPSEITACEITKIGKNSYGEVMEALQKRVEAIQWGYKSEKRTQLFLLKTKDYG